MATQSGIVAWEILWTEKPGKLQSMGGKIVGHDLVTKQQQCNMLIIKENRPGYMGLLCTIYANFCKTALK